MFIILYHCIALYCIVMLLCLCDWIYSENDLYAVLQTEDMDLEVNLVVWD